MKKVGLLLICISMIIPLKGVKALTLNDLYKDLNSLESSYNASKKKANLSQAELNKVKASISSIEKEIKVAQSEIKKAEEDIVKSENKIKQKKEETNQMLLYLQVSGGKTSSMLEYVFQAEDYTDFIYRYSVVTQMSDYNKELLDELNALVEELKIKKSTLAKKQENLNVKNKELQAKYAIVEAQVEEDKEDGLSIAQQISEKKKVIKTYENMGCSRNQNVYTCGRKPSAPSRVSGGGSPISAGGKWVYPLSSFSQSSYYGEPRTCYRNGKKETCYHYAVDLGAPEYSTVYAVAEGTVISKTTSTCGGTVIQIAHPSGYVSLYMHLIDGYVSTGSWVNAAQPIGTSGGGPKEIAIHGDTCTEGPHLHFAMAYGSSLIGKSSTKGSTFNPGEIFGKIR